MLLALSSVTHLLSLDLLPHPTEEDILVLERRDVGFIHLDLYIRTEHTIGSLDPNPAAGISLSILVLWTPELLYQERFFSLFYRMYLSI